MCLGHVTDPENIFKIGFHVPLLQNRKIMGNDGSNVINCAPSGEADELETDKIFEMRSQPVPPRQ